MMQIVWICIVKISLCHYLVVKHCSCFEAWFHMNDFWAVEDVGTLLRNHRLLRKDIVIALPRSFMEYIILRWHIAWYYCDAMNLWKATLLSSRLKELRTLNSSCLKKHKVWKFHLSFKRGKMCWYFIIPCLARYRKWTGNSVASLSEYTTLTKSTPSVKLCHLKLS